ncbi:rod shape-determining protein RodA [Candidatus Termititenax spirochaetophilus]|uniref:Rod shape-determining protein RodA n=1 Tax=Candidatus Termititenax spirochaetophilus TaxID=2218522 RepID=A0A388T842_9BACT|nr:rod shape-determining protein RodA [Candidatus Termititenax spirochaetophilus]
MDLFSKSGYRPWRNFDWRIFLTGLILSLIGLLSVAATNNPSQLKRQMVFLVIGLLVFFFVSSINFRNFKRVAEVLFCAAIFLLIVVLNMGHTVYGAQRWLNLAGFTFQPTELVKLAMIFMLAKFFEQKQVKLDTILDILPGFILVGVPFFLIYKQPDLGSAIVLVVIFVVMSYWAGMKPSRLFMLASPLLSILALYAMPVYPLLSWSIYLLLVAAALWLCHFPLLDSAIYFALNFFSGLFSSFFWNSLSLYQRNRIISFINPDIDPLARGLRYHTVKSVIAVGSGGFFGKGLFHGSLTNLQYIPQQHTDFVFSVIGEEFGFFGAALTVLLLFYLLYRVYLGTAQAADDFGRYLSVGILTLLSFQIIINISMNIGLSPVVGLPLPFISYGGTALVMSWLALGLVQSVCMHRQTIKM